MAFTVHPRAFLEHRRARRQADRAILLGDDSGLAWRVAELTSDRERKLCARALRDILRELDVAVVPGGSPLRWAALRPWSGLLERIGARVAGGEPVSPAGMVAVNELLTSPDSCLYAPGVPVEPALRDVLRRLEPR